MAKCHAAKKEVVVVVFHCSGCIDGEDLKWPPPDTDGRDMTVLPEVLVW